MKGHEFETMRSVSEEVGLELFRKTRRHAYRVGGWTRAKQMAAEFGGVPKDSDLTTGATPEQILEALPDAEYKSDFPRVIVKRSGHEIEIASFRGYLPEQQWCFPPPLLSHLDEATALLLDASRRDFTLNAIYCQIGSGEIFDPKGGRADIKARKLRTCGCPNLTFMEIPKRMLRAIRFACQYGLTLDDSIVPAIQRCRQHLVWTDSTKSELLKMLTGPQPSRAMHLLQETRLIDGLVLEPAVTAN